MLVYAVCLWLPFKSFYRINFQHSDGEFSAKPSWDKKKSDIFVNSIITTWHNEDDTIERVVAFDLIKTWKKFKPNKWMAHESLHQTCGKKTVKKSYEEKKKSHTN